MIRGNFVAVGVASDRGIGLDGVFAGDVSSSAPCAVADEVAGVDSVSA